MNIILKAICALALLLPGASLAMSASPDQNNPMSAASQAMQSGQKQFEQGASDFNAVNSGQTAGSQQSGVRQQAPQTSRMPQVDPRAQALQGSPETGYAGTWTDPATGDIITSVIAPTPRNDNQQNYPVIIEPQVAPDWNYSGSDFGHNWQGSYPQWGNYPGQGWQQPQPHYRPHHQPPYYNPAQGYYPPPPGSFNPNYRPLQPEMPPMAGAPNQNFPPNNGTPPPPGQMPTPPQGYQPPLPPPPFPGGNRPMWPSKYPPAGYQTLKRPNNPSIWSPGDPPQMWPTPQAPAAIPPGVFPNQPSHWGPRHNWGPNGWGGR